MSELPDEVIDTYIGTEAQEDEVLVLNLSVGEVYKLPALLKADKGAVVMKWNSSDDSVVSVNHLGMLAARAAGDAKLTVTASNGKKAVVEVHVSAE